MVRFDAAERLARLVAFLGDPATHRLEPGAVAEPIETHGAVVFLAGDRAYKIKKPVALPYMDLSTLARRRRICRREVEINRRNAPQIYLGLGAVTLGRDAAWHLRGPEEPTVDGERMVEPVVVMRRFDDEALFDRLAERGRLSDADLDRLAMVVAESHAAAPKHRRRSGADRVADVLAVNRSGILAGTPAVFAAVDAHRLLDRTEAAAEAARAILDARARRGRVRRCHGDLHLRNVFRGDDGRPVLFDALEFDENLATVDVAYDLAFLLMDLLHRGFGAGANRLWNGWLAATGDDGAAATLPLFLSMRAAVRAHVGATSATQHGFDDHQAGEARRYLEEALRYLDPRPPVLVAIGGISGTGKTTLARAVAPWLGGPPGAVVLRSDEIRKRRFHVPPTERLPDAAYAPEVSRQVFSEIHRRARRIAASGAPVVADAVYGRPEDRRAVAVAAARAGVAFTGVWLELPEAMARDRVEHRIGDASDATAGVVARQAETIVPPADWLRLDARRPIEELASEVLKTFGSV